MTECIHALTLLSCTAVLHCCLVLPACFFGAAGQANPAIQWHTLEKGKGPAAAGVAVAAVAPQQQQEAAAAGASVVRQYPSSKGTKDWSKVEGESLVSAEDNNMHARYQEV